MYVIMNKAINVYDNGEWDIYNAFSPPLKFVGAISVKFDITAYKLVIERIKILYLVPITWGFSEITVNLIQI